MAILPSKIEQRSDLDCRLGIKSSLNHISSVVALSYLLYCANDKSNEIIYADEVKLSNGRKKLVLKDCYKQWIMDNYTVDEDSLDNNPLLTSQLEALQVGLGLMFHLAKISFVDFPTTDTKERTGGDRFRKIMKFALNMKLLDLYLMAWPNGLMKTEIISWLNNSPSDTAISEGLKQILTAFSEETQYKIRANGEEVIFQQIGIYNNISNEDGVIAKDEQEDVGPFRIFKSFVREGLHPFLYLENNEFRCNKSEELDVYDKIVETTLNLSPKKTVIYQEVLEDLKLNNSEPDNTHQIIYYGAPGTGKSHKIKEQLEGVSKENIFRTTFHPDSDYSTFVGAYKPTRDERPLYGLFGKETVRLKDGKDLSEDIITYKFIPQAFLNAYMQAYRKPNENVYLIIEEINRGNCAQIFGDLFQLLDRNESGVSEYTIKADADLKVFLEEELGKDKPGIEDGELCLPSNLYIYATMNTSDQSLFPIDSAFKRRWDWEYEPIKYKNTDWVIDVQSNKYSWVSFQKEINKRIFEATSSEDKMLGDYFVNPSDGVITEKMLLNKILFYLWNDVCKDGEGDIFKVSDTDDVSFSELYGDGGKQKLADMMNYLGVNRLQEFVEEDDENDDSEEENNSGTGKDKTKYAINGNGKYAKKNLATELVKLYVENNPEMSALDVVSKWKSLGYFVSHFIETQEDYDKRTDKSPRVNTIQCNGEIIYVSTNGWGGQGIMDSLINAIPEDWNLKVEKLL